MAGTPELRSDDALGRLVVGLGQQTVTSRRAAGGVEAATGAGRGPAGRRRPPDRAGRRPRRRHLENHLGKLDEDRQIVRDFGPRILRHVAKEVKHEQFCDLDVLTVTVDTRALV